MRSPIATIIVLQALLLTLFASPSFAHKIRIFAWEDGGRIMTESKFSGGRPAKGATVSVVNSDTGQELLAGTTDAEGIFSFAVPGTGVNNLDIVVDGGDGHKNHWQYAVDRSAGPSPLPADPPKEQVTGAPPVPHQGGQTASAAEAALADISVDQFNRILELAIDKQLAPIKKTLAENSEKEPTLQDILGGIGYILGLFGIAAYMHSRKNKKE